MTPWSPPQPWSRGLAELAESLLYDPRREHAQTWRREPAKALILLAREAAR